MLVTFTDVSIFIIRAMTEISSSKCFKIKALLVN